jgi:hypothetical protein
MNVALPVVPLSHLEGPQDGWAVNSDAKATALPCEHNIRTVGQVNATMGQDGSISAE